MLEVSAAITRRLIAELGTKVPAKDGMRSWLEKGSYQINNSSVHDCVRLENVHMGELNPFLSWDYERFCFSSLESLMSCKLQRAHPKAIGWPLLKLYYSAFFGAHSILRATGQGVLRLERAVAAHLTEYAKFFIDELVISSGTYESRLEQDAFRSINLVLRRLPDTGGAHEQFWRRFHAFLSELSEQAAAQNEPGAVRLIGEIAELQKILTANGFSNGAWLSAVRNQINYQHQYGVWYPYHRSRDAAVSMEGVGRESGGIRCDFNPSRDPLCAFSAACQILAAINTDVARALARRPAASRFKGLWERLESSA